MRPYYLEHFSDLQFLRSATPIDYPTIISDTWYRNMVDYRLAVLRSNQLNVYPEAMAEMRMVLALLEEELETPVGAEQGP
jgi:hypothetical protein